MKECRVCKDVKELDDFHNLTSSKDGKRTECKDCHKANRKESYYKNKEYIDSQNRKYYHSNKDKCSALQKEWVINNRGHSASIKAKYRASKNRATVSWSDKELIKDIYTEAQYQNMQVDHIVPLQGENVCGLHWEGNMQLLTKSENCSKSNKFNGA